MLTHRNLVANVQQSGAVAGITEKDHRHRLPAVLPHLRNDGSDEPLSRTACQARDHAALRPGTVPAAHRGSFARRGSTSCRPWRWRWPSIPWWSSSTCHRSSRCFSGAAPLGPETEIAVGERLGAMSVQGYGMTEMSPISHMTIAGNVRHGSSGAGGAVDRMPDREPRDAGGHAPGRRGGSSGVRGPQVMKGYLNNADATAQTLTPDGWLRTGDLAIIDADGFMFIRDRLKETDQGQGLPGCARRGGGGAHRPSGRGGCRRDRPSRRGGRRGSDRLRGARNRARTWARRSSRPIARAALPITSTRSHTVSSRRCRNRPPGRSCGGSCARRSEALPRPGLRAFA